jgi:hypothetical protein
MSKLAKPLPPQSDLSVLFSYDPNSGVLTRLSDGRTRWAIGSAGYEIISVRGQGILKHRLILQLAVGGITTADQVDHINGIKSDNRLSNLRVVSALENNWNKGKQRRNRHGFAGVRKDEETGRFKAQITTGGRSLHLGTFDTAQEAGAAYAQAAHKHRGKFACDFRRAEIARMANAFVEWRSKSGQAAASKS